MPNFRNQYTFHKSLATPKVGTLWELKKQRKTKKNEERRPRRRKALKGLGVSTRHSCGLRPAGLGAHEEEIAPTCSPRSFHVVHAATPAPVSLPTRYCMLYLGGTLAFIALHDEASCLSVSLVLVLSSSCSHSEAKDGPRNWVLFCRGNRDVITDTMDLDCDVSWWVVWCLQGELGFTGSPPPSLVFYLSLPFST